MNRVSIIYDYFDIQGSIPKSQLRVALFVTVDEE